jgi:LysM repeat protein
MSPKFPQPKNLPTEYVCLEVYTVRTGDTLYSISQRYGVPVAMLMEANRILNPYNLRHGQKICIPGHRSDCLEPAHDPFDRHLDYPCPPEEPITCPEEEVTPMPMPTRSRTGTASCANNCSGTRVGTDADSNPSPRLRQHCAYADAAPRPEPALCRCRLHSPRLRRHLLLCRRRPRLRWESSIP